MPYQMFYGNRYTEGVGDNLFEGARKTEDFARKVENARTNLARRRQSLEEARLAAAGKDQDLADMRADRKFDEDSKRWWSESRARREEEAYQRRMGNRREDRLGHGLELAEGREDRLERQLGLTRRDNYRAELNHLRSGGGRRRKKDEPVPGEHYEHTDARGKAWIVPEGLYRQIQSQNMQRDASRDWYLSRGLPDPNAPKPDGRPRKLSPRMKEEIATLRRKATNYERMHFALERDRRKKLDEMIDHYGADWGNEMTDKDRASWSDLSRSMRTASRQAAQATAEISNKLTTDDYAQRIGALSRHTGRMTARQRQILVVAQKDLSSSDPATRRAAQAAIDWLEEQI